MDTTPWLVGIGVVSFVSAASVSAALGIRQLPSGTPTPAFNVHLFALKALAVGTCLCLAGGAVGVWGVTRYLKVNNVQEFNVRMREIVPAFSRKLERAFIPFQRKKPSEEINNEKPDL